MGGKREKRSALRSSSLNSFRELDLRATRPGQVIDESTLARALTSTVRSIKMVKQVHLHSMRGVYGKDSGREQRNSRAEPRRMQMRCREAETGSLSSLDEVDL